MSEHLPLQRIRTLLLAVMALVAAGFVLHYAQGVILPFLVAFFAMIILSPLVVRMEGRGLPTWLSVPLAMVSVAVFLLIIGLAFYLNLGPIIDAAPEYEARGQELLGKGMEALEKIGVDETRVRELLSKEGEDDKKKAEDGEPAEEKSIEELIVGKIEEHTGDIISFTTGGVTSFMGFVGQGVLVLLYLLFMLFEAARFHEKAEKAFGPDSPIFDTLKAISHDVQVYMAWKTGISVVTGAMTALICAIFGVDFPLFWGTLAFGLNFIPNVGSVVASIFPCLLALFQSGPWVALGLLITLIVMQNVMGSLIEPRLMGKSLSLSPLVLLLSLVFWGWLWGVVGMVLAVPIAVCIKIICQHTPGLQPVSTLFEA
ncbi:MAG: AI-2E family transporter [Planctomycetota bacterium]|jgi:predicted PurR-regulated permease PerM